MHEELPAFNKTVYPRLANPIGPSPGVPAGEIGVLDEARQHKPRHASFTNLGSYTDRKMPSCFRKNGPVGDLPCTISVIVTARICKLSVARFLWYHAGWFDGIGYAISQDGLHWERPMLDVEPGTNRVLAQPDHLPDPDDPGTGQYYPGNRGLTPAERRDTAGRPAAR